MPHTKAHDYAEDGNLNGMKAHLSSNPNDVHAKNEVIIQ
jgi:hypothetical protein